MDLGFGKNTAGIKQYMENPVGGKQHGAESLWLNWEPGRHIVCVMGLGRSSNAVSLICCEIG